MPDFHSPLRYPGGKSKLIPYVIETLRLNNLEGGTYVEPFAGGAAIAWHLLLENHVRSVYINDLNPSVFSFWYIVLNSTDQLCEAIENVDITIDEWYMQRKIQNSPDASVFQKGFSTLFLNRTNRSGILKAGVIGGMAQSGNYKLDCRFNKARLISQIKRIAEHKHQIQLSNLDAAEFISDVVPLLENKSLINIDPPYYHKGKELYQNFLEHEDHYRLYECIKEIKQPWIVTYDDTPEINEIYSEYNPRSFGLTYTAQVKRKGNEVIIYNPEIEICPYKPDITFNELGRLKSMT